MLACVHIASSDKTCINILPDVIFLAYLTCTYSCTQQTVHEVFKIIRNCPSINLFQYLTVICLILLIILFFNQFSSGYSHYHLSQFYTQHTPYLKTPSKDIHKFLLLSITKPSGIPHRLTVIYGLLAFTFISGHEAHTNNLLDVYKRCKGFLRLLANW